MWLVNLGQWQYNEILKKAPKFVNKKKHALDNFSSRLKIKSFGAKKPD